MDNSIYRVRWYEHAFWTGLLMLGIAAVLMLIPAEAWADLSKIEGDIDAKFDDLVDLTKKVGWGIAGVGAIVFFVRVMNGNPDAWGLGLKFLLGAIGVYISGDIVDWLQE